MRAFRIEGGVAVVTGAAGGIGRCVATRLAGLGCDLALVDIDRAALVELGDLLRARGVAVSVHPMDVARKDEIMALPTRVLEAHGRVTLLVNNAGISLGGYFSQLSLDDIERLIDINLLAVIRMTHVFLPALRDGQAAHIVNVSSLFGLIAPPGQTAYAAAKFGVRGFSEALRHELRGTPVGVTVVHPGGVRTNISNNMLVSAQWTEAQIADERRVHAKLLTLDPDQAAREIVDAIGQRRRRLIIGRDAKRAATIQRLFPVGYWSVFEMMNSRIRERHAEHLARMAPARS